MTYLPIPDDLDKRLAALAAQAHLSKDEYAAQLLEDVLEDQEDYLEALKISDRIEKGLEKTFSYEEILKDLGLDKETTH